MAPDEPLESLLALRTLLAGLDLRDATRVKACERDIDALERMLDAPGPRPRFPSLPALSRWAIAGAAFVALESSDRGASELLDEWLGHEDLRVRTWVVDAIARTCRTRGNRLSAKAAEALGGVARDDPAFEPRYAARGWLVADGRRCDAEPSGGVYAFEARLGRASRRVELRSEQTLDALAWAIVGAFGWDADHLYSFSLSTLLEDRVFEASFEGNPWTGEGAAEGPVSMPVGALGLVAGHSFTLLYDFGDKNVFAVRLVEVRPKAEARANFPRVAASVGKAPAQYR